MIAVHGQADLLEVVLTLEPAGRLACGLHGGKEQGDQDAMITITPAARSR